jgi:DNA-binding response OmpR family regulator
VARILVVEDDLGIRELMSEALGMVGHRVAQAQDAAGALAEFFSFQPDLVILDLRLPGQSGFEVCQRIRAVASVPILMATSLAEEDDIVAGLRLGADDYLAKPFTVKVLLARVEALLRRAAGPTLPEPVLEIGDLEVDLQRREARRGGARLELTPTEFRLLEHLALKAGSVLGPRELLWRAQDYDASEREAQTIIKVHISHLREKIEPDPQRPRYIVSVRGFGYMLRGEG